jgi:Pectate lyase superfamily protein
MIMPWKKRLKTTPNDVRRAWLLAAPFVLLGASKAEADTAFTNFAFARATGTGRVNRTMPARLDDIHNVRDFGALGNGSKDDRAAIQAAIDACCVFGGTVFFPFGNYIITGRLVVSPGVNGAKRITFLGQGGGSKLTMNVRDYILYVKHGNAGGGGGGDLVTSVEKLTFVHNFDGVAPTTTEPPNSPDIVSTVIACRSGTGGNLRLAVDDLLPPRVTPRGTTGMPITHFRVGQSIRVAGVAQASANTTTPWTINAVGPALSQVGSTASGLGGNVRITLSSSSGIIVGDRVFVFGVVNISNGASNEANNIQFGQPFPSTVTAVNDGGGTNIVVNIAFVTAGSGGTIEPQWVEIPLAFTTGGSGGTIRYNGDGCGCLYMGGTIGAIVRDCVFMFGTGIGIFYPGFMGLIEGCELTGSNSAANFTTYGPNKTIGILTRSSAMRGGKHTSLGHGIVMIMGVSTVDFMDLEHCGIGFKVGKSPIDWWESNQGAVATPDFGSLTSGGFSIRGVLMEACNHTYIHLEGASGGNISGVTIHASSQIGVAQYGVRCVSVGGTTIGVYMGGAFSVAAVDASGASGYVRFIGTNSGGNSPAVGGNGVSWIMPTSLNAGPIYFEGCDVEGAFPFSLFQPNPGFNAQVRCSDSSVPTYDTASNVGKKLAGGGSNRVLARWSTVARITAAASWAAGATTITMPTATGVVSNGMGIWDETATALVGVVSSYTGTILTLTGGAQTASRTSSDVLIFSTWVIAG